jgi:hypothetical protein
MKISLVTRMALTAPKPAKRCIGTGRLADGRAVNRR